MAKETWPEAAMANDSLVAELLLRLKQHPSSSDSSQAPPPLLPPPSWGHRKNRSKPSAATTAIANGIRKEQRASPTTHLSWSGGGGSTSDGYDESSRPSDLSSVNRSCKANEGASTSTYNNKSKKRKTFGELKEQEGFLLKERLHLNRIFLLNHQELASMRVTLHQQMATSQNLKRIKIDLDHNPKNKTGTTLDHESQMESLSLRVSCRVEAEMETWEQGFVLPDLNMTPSDEDLMMMS